MIADDRVARMSREEYSAEAESFLASLNEEYFQHGAGLKEELKIAPIYERHERLFRLEEVMALLSTRGTRADRYLAHAAAFGFVENVLRSITECIAALETHATVDWDGGAVPYRKARVLASNEPDTARRRDLEQRIIAVTEGFNPESERRLGASHQAAAQLSFPDYVTMCDELAGLRLAALAAETQLLLERSAHLYRELLDRHLRAAGVDPAEATTGDVTFVRHGHQFNGMFPKELLLPALRETLLGLGIDLAGQENILLDLEERPLKSPRAFCAPVRVPGDVRLVIRPRGGHDDYLTLFHEAGHAEHFASTRAEAPFSFRCLGDNSVTEAYAFLLGRLPSTPAWLERVMGLREIGEYLSLARLTDLYYTRRYCAKLAYELELHRAARPDEKRGRYAELLGQAVQVRVWPQNFLFDLDDFFYCGCYLRAWMFEAQLRRRLVEEYGSDWFARPAAGLFLRQLWSLGQEFTVEELAHRLGYPGLQAGPLMEDLTSPVAG